MSGAGYFYTPEDQEALTQLQRKQAYARALLSQGMEDPGKAAYGGLRNAGNSILGAFLANRADKSEANLAQTAGAKYARDLGSILTGNQAQTTPTPVPQPSPQISTAAGSGPQMPGVPISTPQGAIAGSDAATQPQGQSPISAPPQDPLQRVVATGNPALMQQYGMPLLQHQIQRQEYVQDHTQIPLAADDIQKLGLPKGTVATKDQFGGINIINKPDYMSPDAFNQKVALAKIEQAPQWAQLAESSRHNKVEETIAQNPFGGGIGVPGANGKTGDDFLATLPPGLAAQIKAVGTYRQPAPAGRTSPTGIKFMTLVNQAYPDYDASSYGAKTKARNDFTTGKNGNTVRSLNVAVQHLDQLGQLSDALANGNVQLVNKIGNQFASQTGSAAPTNFNAARQLVGDEIVKAIVGAGGGVSDREEAAHNISAASSPAQLAGVIKTYQGLLSGQLAGLKQQYEKSTGLNDFEDYLAPETKAKLQNHSQQGPGAGNVSQKIIRYDANGRRIP